MTRLLWAAGAIALALLTQIACSSWAPALSERVDLLLIVVVWFGVSGSPVLAMLSGAAAGLIQDVLFGGLLGRGGFRKVLVGYLVSAVGSRIALDSWWTWSISLALATLIDHGTGVALGQLMGLPLADPFSALILEKMLMNAVVGTILFLVIRRVSAERNRRASMRARSVRRVR